MEELLRHGLTFVKDIYDIITDFESVPAEPLALATLVRVQGSSYRRPGARMLISLDRRTVGSLSGGCLEEEVTERAREVLRTGRPSLMTFDTRRRFGCNGALEILVERVRDDFLTGLSSHHHARRRCQIATGFSTGSRIVTQANEINDGDLIQEIEPCLQLLVIGDGPDSAALCGMANILGWLVQDKDCASELADSYDPWTAAIVKTHNYGRDFAALRALLAMDLRYVGLMGPRARREQLLGDLLDTGIEPKPNLFAPAGLDLGESSPEAIALAIVAEIQAVFGGGSGQPLRERRAPIHGAETAGAVAS